MMVDIAQARRHVADRNPALRTKMKRLLMDSSLLPVDEIDPRRTLLPESEPHKDRVKGKVGGGEGGGS